MHAISLGFEVCDLLIHGTQPPLPLCSFTSLLPIPHSQQKSHHIGITSQTSSPDKRPLDASRPIPLYPLHPPQAHPGPFQILATALQDILDPSRQSRADLHSTFRRYSRFFRNAPMSAGASMAEMVALVVMEISRSRMPMVAKTLGGYRLGHSGNMVRWLGKVLEGAVMPAFEPRM